MLGKRFVQLFFLIFVIGVFGQEPPPSLLKKMRKAVAQTFPKEQILLDHDSDNLSFQNGHLYSILSEDQSLMGYAYLGYAPSKTDTFDYLVVFDADFVIKNIKVLVYREDYGGEIGSKRWLRQFIGKDPEASFDYGQNIAAISGATISVQSMTRAVNSLLSNIHQSPLYR